MPNTFQCHKILGITFLFLTGCASSGPYGYARQYRALPEESAALADSQDYDAVMAQRHPDAWAVRPIQLFGVVENSRESEEGGYSLLLSVRRLEARNLCEEDDERSCRVTVTARNFGKILVHVELKEQDIKGTKAIKVGSLLRVVGKLDPMSEMPKMTASYYRHWPENQYVDSDAHSYMRK
jgi:hypothetical protein